MKLTFKIYLSLLVLELVVFFMLFINSLWAIMLLMVINFYKGILWQYEHRSYLDLEETFKANKRLIAKLRGARK
jgi:hypothetical protein